MKPEDVLRRFDEEIGEATADALGEELGNSPRIVELTKAVMTDVSPLLAEFERQVRERVAEQIEAEQAADGDSSSWDGGMLNAARIARGES